MWECASSVCIVMQCIEFMARGLLGASSDSIVLCEVSTYSLVMSLSKEKSSSLYFSWHVEAQTLKRHVGPSHHTPLAWETSSPAVLKQRPSWHSSTAMALRKLASQFACTTGLRVGISPALHACRESIWRSFATGARLAAIIHKASALVEPLMVHGKCHRPHVTAMPLHSLPGYGYASLSA